MLEAIQGYRIPFSQQPYQPYPPRALTHSQAEEALMQQEIQSMLEKHAIEETTPRGDGFLSTIFLVKPSLLLQMTAEPIKPVCMF